MLPRPQRPSAPVLSQVAADARPIGGRGRHGAMFVGVATVHELLARAEARLPRDRQASDAIRRAALGVVCGVAETAVAAELTAARPLWTVEVPDDPHDLLDRTGLAARDVRAGLALLLNAGVVERVVGHDTRLRVTEHAVVAAPVLAAITWAPLRAALRTVAVTVAPALAVARAIAARTGGIRADGAGDPVALTQHEIADATLFGRTAVVAALRGLVEVGALELAARRGTWTECRLLPPVFAGTGYRVTEHIVERDPPPREHAARTNIASVAPPTTSAASALPIAGAGLTLDIGGVLVPLTPGMSVQPPPGAQLSIEIDPDGRRYLRIDAAIRVGPLP